MAIEENISTAFPAKTGAVASADILPEDRLCFRLSEKAERVRWRMEDIPWKSIAKDKVTPEWLNLVRESASSELTTFTASQRFLKDFWDDPDFSQWISVWFYEETRHPHALLKWLGHFGIRVDDNFFLQGRGTAPFMKSRMGTLVTNIISEMFASANYYNLHIHSPEPVLSAIALNLSNDEARHASSFYSYAKKMLVKSVNPDHDRRDALKVLYLWFQENGRVKHPVNELFARQKVDEKFQGFLAGIQKTFEDVQYRALRRIGNLVGASISTPEEAFALLRN